MTFLKTCFHFMVAVFYLRYLMTLIFIFKGFFHSIIAIILNSLCHHHISFLLSSFIWLSFLFFRNKTLKNWLDIFTICVDSFSKELSSLAIIGRRSQLSVLEGLWWLSFPREDKAISCLAVKAISKYGCQLS